jgi:hypothetical protein
MQNITDELIANNPSLVNDTLLPRLKMLNATEAEGTIITSVVITSQAPTTNQPASPIANPTIYPTVSPTTSPTASPTSSPSLSPTASPTP